MVSTLTLFQKLLSNDAAVRHNAQQELAGIDIESKKQMIPTLIEALADKNIRSMAANGLSVIGPMAVPALIQCLHDEKKEKIFRYMASLVLEKIGTPEAQEAVKRFRQ